MSVNRLYSIPYQNQLDSISYTNYIYIDLSHWQHIFTLFEIYCESIMERSSNGSGICSQFYWSPYRSKKYKCSSRFSWMKIDLEVSKTSTWIERYIKRWIKSSKLQSNRQFMNPSNRSHTNSIQMLRIKSIGYRRRFSP